MRKFRSMRAAHGATRLGFLDVLTALVVLAILIFAAWRQFPVYRSGPSADYGAASAPQSH